MLTHTKIRSPHSALIIPKLEPVPERPWEGSFQAHFRNGRHYTVPVKLVLQTFPQMIEGKGRSMTFPTSGTDADRCFDLNGSRLGDNVHFNLWFAGNTVSHVPLVCQGTLNATGDAIGGEWSMSCLNMPLCNCGGPTGPFELKRCA
jgi:hypothetical protein